MRHVTLTLVALAALGGCRDGAAAPQPTGAAVADGSAAAPAFTRDVSATGQAPAQAAADETGAPAPEDPAAEMPADEDAADEDSASSGAASGPTKPAVLVEEPSELANVEVKNVGMHIGGGKNTADEKRPIRATVSKHYDGLRRCYTKAVKPANDATFGVDLRIPGQGGTPTVSEPRNGLKGEGVTACLVSVFEAIEFPRQPHGQARMVSYSVRFRKK